MHFTPLWIVWGPELALLVVVVGPRLAELVPVPTGHDAIAAGPHAFDHEGAVGAGGTMVTVGVRAVRMRDHVALRDRTSLVIDDRAAARAAVGEHEILGDRRVGGDLHGIAVAR